MAFLRKVTLEIDGVGSFDEKMEINFVIKKTKGSMPNKAEINILNLSLDTRLLMETESSLITLSAGYYDLDNEGVIFSGFTSDIIHTPQGNDTITSLVCGDGDKMHRSGYVNSTFKRGTAIKEIILDIQKKSMPSVLLGELVGIPDKKIRRAWTFSKPTKRALDEICRTYGLSWSVQNGVFEVVKDDEYINEITFLTERSLTPPPAFTDKGVDGSTFLNPDLRVNRVVNLDSPNLSLAGKSGDYKISSIRHEGSARGGSMLTYFTGEQIQNGKAKI